MRKTGWRMLFFYALFGHATLVIFEQVTPWVAGIIMLPWAILSLRNSKFAYADQ